jgi:hypothetical protein
MNILFAHVGRLFINVVRPMAAEGTDMWIKNLVLGSAALLVMANVVLADEKSLDAKKETPAKAASI